MSDPFYGEIKMVGFNYAPRNWALCDGTLLQVNQHQALFALLSNTFGGDGRSNFGLPDLRGRSPIGVGQSAGTSYRMWGQRSGYEAVPLNVNQIPAHSHTAQAHASSMADGMSPTGATWGGDSSGMMINYSTEEPDVVMREGAVVNESTGAGFGHQNMQPFLAVYFIIALEGLWPSRP